MKAFDSTNLRALMESSHVGAEKLAEATNINVHTIKNYLRDTTPTLEALITLADYFAVPLDFIAGRCDEALSREVLKDYGRHFMELRRAPFEAYLLKCATGREPMFCDDKIEAPWPYNLLDAVFRSIDDTEEYLSTVLNCVDEDDIMLALDTLSVQEKTTVLLYFRDGISFRKISELPEYNIGHARVRQIVLIAVRKLRHPSRANILRYGSTLAKQNSEIESRRRELNETKRKLEDYERELEAWRARLNKSANELTKQCKDEETAEQLAGDLEGTALLRMPLGDLGLDTRAYNCLARAEMENLGDVVRLIESGRMLLTRNLGHHCARQILDRIKEVTGKDYRYLYPKI